MGFKGIRHLENGRRSFKNPNFPVGQPDGTGRDSLRIAMDDSIVVGTDFFGKIRHEQIVAEHGQ